MKALSLSQPWAALVVSGIKLIENRTWSSKHRGPLLIHASKTWDEYDANWIIEKRPDLKDFVRNGEETRIRGALVGKVKMTDCVTNSTSEWFFGPFGFVFVEPVRFEKPVPYKGQLNIFEVDVEI